MKKLFPLAILSLTLAVPGHASPFMAIGDGAELFLTGSLSVRSDDNIFLTQSAESDVIYDITPGAELTFGKDSQLNGALTASVAFSNYADNSKLNSVLAGVDFVVKYNDGKLKLGFNTSFHELSQNTADVRPIVGTVPRLNRRDVWAAGANGEAEFTQLTSVGVGLQFTHENYKPAGFTDSDSLTVPIDLYYKWTPKIDASIGYRYRDYAIDIGQDSTDHFFNIGARGDFSPKLTGKLAVGFTTRKLSGGGGGDDTTIGLDSSFTYEISPKTSLQFGASNDFGTSPQGVQQKNFSVRGSVSSKLTEQWSVNGGLNYRGIDYGSRTDDYWEGNVGVSYIFDANVNLAAGYVHRSYESVIAGSGFKGNEFRIAANFRY